MTPLQWILTQRDPTIFVMVMHNVATIYVKWKTWTTIYRNFVVGCYRPDVPVTERHYSLCGFAFVPCVIWCRIYDIDVAAKNVFDVIRRAYNIISFFNLNECGVGGYLIIGIVLYLKLIVKMSLKTLMWKRWCVNILLRETFLQNSVLRYFILSDCEFRVFIEISKYVFNKDKTNIIGVQYLPPDQNLKLFTKHIEENCCNF